MTNEVCMTFMNDAESNQTWQQPTEFQIQSQMNRNQPFVFFSFGQSCDGQESHKIDVSANNQCPTKVTDTYSADSSGRILNASLACSGSKQRSNQSESYYEEYSPKLMEQSESKVTETIKIDRQQDSTERVAESNIT